jgi:hypothetical protein
MLNVMKIGHSARATSKTEMNETRWEKYYTLFLNTLWVFYPIYTLTNLIEKYENYFGTFLKLFDEIVYEIILYEIVYEIILWNYFMKLLLLF